ncbi:LuxR C-terminal-related transcriptional regulator [bacterium]|nr:LuxR C-terminal-related transcriptional regulator [bacterium]
MNHKERWAISALLLGIIVLVVFDLATDFKAGGRWWHLGAEGLMAITAMGGIFLLIRDTLTLKRHLASEKERSLQLKTESENWRTQSKKYIEGLSQAIDQQLNTWNLTDSEKEVAFLLLKGLSFKEIAHARNTSEKTARAQSASIYSKSGLSGRSELSAFFLEDLLLPNNSE